MAPAALVALVAIGAGGRLHAQPAPVTCPVGTDSLVAAGWRAYRADSIALAARRFTGALGRCPRDHDANIGRAYALLRQGSVAAADSLLRAQARRTPRSLDLWEARAIVAGRRGAAAEAVDAWRRVLILAPAESQARAAARSELDRLSPGWEPPPPPVPGGDAAAWRALEAVEQGAWTGDDSLTIRMGHDEAHLFIALEHPAGRGLPWDSARLELAIDTHRSPRGRSVTPGARLRSAEPFDVVLEITGPHAAGIAGRRDTVAFGARDTAMRGPAPARAAADWWYDEAAGMLELRLPWALLGVTQPAARRIGTTVTEGFRVGLAAYRPGRGVLAALPARDDDGEWLHSRFRTWSWPMWTELTWPD